jgi:hypothetical protein
MVSGSLQGCFDHSIDSLTTATPLQFSDWDCVSVPAGMSVPSVPLDAETGMYIDGYLSVKVTNPASDTNQDFTDPKLSAAFYNGSTIVSLGDLGGAPVSPIPPGTSQKVTIYFTTQATGTIFTRCVISTLLASPPGSGYFRPWS